jgi:hypothetical protein
LDIGVDAIPMVALVAMCSGFILAMQVRPNCGDLGLFTNSLSKFQIAHNGN